MGHTDPPAPLPGNEIQSSSNKTMFCSLFVVVVQREETGHVGEKEKGRGGWNGRGVVEDDDCLSQVQEACARARGREKTGDELKELRRKKCANEYWRIFNKRSSSLITSCLPSIAACLHEPPQGGTHLS